MPLPVHERFALWLWLVAARCLDVECCPEAEAPGATSGREVARSDITGAAEKAAALVKSDQDLRLCFFEYINQLNVLTSEHPGIAWAQEQLRGEADADLPGNGDGPALDDSGVPVRTGILEIAGLVESRVRRMLAAAGISIGDACRVHYLTTLVQVSKLKKQVQEIDEFAGFRVAGGTYIDCSPRRVELLIKHGELRARDLLHLSYTLHHELICHAFQGVLSATDMENAPDRCDWSEGWMDAVAYDQSLAWLSSAPDTWLPLRGEVAKDTLRTFHAARYDRPSLEDDDIRRRRNARDAYKELEKSLEALSADRPVDQARRTACDFSLAFNAHADARSDHWQALARRLRIVLVSRRVRSKIAVAAAAYGFLTHRDLARLDHGITLAEDLI